MIRNLIISALLISCTPTMADTSAIVAFDFNTRGARVADGSGNRHDGTAYVEPQDLTQKPKQADLIATEDARECLALRGGQYVHVTKTETLDFGDAFTIETTVKPVGGVMILSSRAGGGVGVELMIHPGDKTVRFMVETPGRTRREIASLKPVELGNRWIDIAAVYDGQRVALFIDGQFQSQGPLTGVADHPNKDLYIGRELAAGANWFIGFIDELRISRGALAKYKIPDDAPQQAAAVGVSVEHIEQQRAERQERLAAVPNDQRPMSVIVKVADGEDIGAKINEISQQHPHGIAMDIPPGRYRFSTTIRPKSGDVIRGIHMGDGEAAEGTILEYAGDGIAIDLQGDEVENVSATRKLCRIEHLSLNNVGNGTIGINAIQVSRYLQLRDMQVSGFTKIGLYIRSSWILNFTGVWVTGVTDGVGLKLEGCNIITFRGGQLDGSAVAAQISGCNTIRLEGISIESGKGPRTIVVDGGSAAVSIVSCHFEDDGERAWIYAGSEDPHRPVKSLRVESCAMLGGDGESFIELGDNVLAATIVSNVFEGAVKQAIHLSASSVYQTSIGGNSVDRRVRAYVSNPYNVEVAPAGYLPRELINLKEIRP